MLCDVPKNLKTGKLSDEDLSFISILSANYTLENGKVRFRPISNVTGRSLFGITWWKNGRAELIEGGVIECDQISKKGSKSLGYRMAAIYHNKPTSLRLVKSANQIARAEKVRAKFKAENYSPMHYAMEACCKALTIPPERVADVVADVTAKTTTKKREQATARAKSDCEKVIACQHHLVKTSASNHRVSNTLTNCKKEIRKHLKFYGEDVVILDVVNCQPFLIACHFGDEPQLLKDTSSGTFYEAIMRAGRLTDRDSVKASVQACFFRHTVRLRNGHLLKPWESKDYPHKSVLKAINKRYPGLMKKIDAARESSSNNQNGFAIWMQREEARIMIGRIVEDMQRVGLPVISIHDGILVRASHESIAADFIRASFMQETGHTPSISIEKRA